MQQSTVKGVITHVSHVGTDSFAFSYTELVVRPSGTNERILCASPQARLTLREGQLVEVTLDGTMMNRNRVVNLIKL